MNMNFITRLFRLIRATWITRYEFLLPTKYNDGTAIPTEKLDETTQELSNRFCGVAFDLVQVQGLWQFRGTTYRDRLVRIRVDTDDAKARFFLRSYKMILKTRFQQVDIWITAQDIEIL